jgi:hypothetical protein
MSSKGIARQGIQEAPTALITGGSAGIGFEIARILAQEGFSLVLVSRERGRLEAAAEALRREEGASVRAYAVDLAEPGAAQRVFERVREDALEIGVLVNNAGIGLYDEHVRLEPDRLARMLQLNVISVAELCRLFGAEMKRRGTGRILNVASTAAYQPAPYFAAYGASKSFVLSFSEALAKELEDHGVTVSCLSPGPTHTAFFDGVDPATIGGGHHLGVERRADATLVARAGVALMLSGGLSRVVGLRNKLLTLSSRFAPRPAVAALSKRLMRPARSAEARR